MSDGGGLVYGQMIILHNNLIREMIALLCLLCILSIYYDYCSKYVIGLRQHLNDRYVCESTFSYALIIIII